MLYLYIAIVLLCETTAISLLREYFVSSRILHFFLGCIAYCLVSLLLVRTFTFADMGIINIIWSVFSMLIVECVGVFEFHEHITRMEVVGIVFVISGIALLPSA